MGKIRINDLARELEVKSKAIIDCLAGLGIEDKKSHSSALDDDQADKVRACIRAQAGQETVTEAPVAPAQVQAPAPAQAQTGAPSATAPSAPVPEVIHPHAPAAPAASHAPAHPAPQVAVHPTAPAAARPTAHAPMRPTTHAVPSHAPSHAMDTSIRVPEVHPGEISSMASSIEEIKKRARKALTPPPPPPKPAAPPAPSVVAKPPAKAPAAGPAAPPAAVPPGVSAPHRAGPLPGTAVPGAPAHVAPRAPGHGVGPVTAPPPSAGARKEAPTARASTAPEATASGRSGEASRAGSGKPAHGGRGGKGTSSQPIYPVAGAKGAPARAPVRRPHEPRPQHPTSTRTGQHPTAPGGVATARPATRMPLHPSGGRLGTAVATARAAAPAEIAITRKITITEGITIKELSEKLEARAKDVIKKLLDKGIFATINQTLDSQTATEIARAFGAETSVISYEEEVIHEATVADLPEDLVPRAPVVTVMGHVDHGKTSLLDAIRETNVTAHEAGGITQHIGAYQVEVNGRKVVFLDTPGHEAFTLMRARGARVTDVVVLVVAADDGVMPQTLEAINHARAAKVPIVVAINKIDKPDALPERVKKQLADNGLMSEEWGGDTVTVEVSAKQHKNLELLLEMILLVADLQGLKANPKRLASGTVLESRLDRGRGPVATMLVENGTLHIGDPFIVGAIYGKVRALFDDRGRPTLEGAPSTPVEVLGLEDVPQAGDPFQVIEDTLKARQISLHRLAKQRDAALAKSARLTLEQLHQQIAAGDVKELALVLKADVQGSVEVLTDTVSKLSTDKVKVKVIHAGVGAITESDVLLASTSNAVIVGFNVRPERKASELAHLEKVDIRLHTIIYNISDEIKKAMVGLLAVVFKEIQLGRAEVRDTFRISGVGTVAGCYVLEGKITRDAKIRLVRDAVVVHEGRVRSVRRFKEDVTEVRQGMECGISIENYNDVKAGDSLESFIVERVAEPVLV
ncbi:MAG TPA: translation initiation factor IF-2 [Terriglobia bacterium]|nr:translation initiation factor IF-2 [Terriglobia bacterium]